MTVIEIEADPEAPTRYGVTIVARKGTYSLCGDCVVGGHHLSAQALFPGMDGPCDRCHAQRTPEPAVDEVLVACGGTGQQIVRRCRRCRGEDGEQPTNKPGIPICRCLPTGPQRTPTSRRTR